MPPPSTPLSGRRCCPERALRTPQLQPPARLASAYGSSVLALVHILGEFNAQIAALEAELAEAFEDHPDAEILRSLPGLGVILGARVLAEFGDDRTRYENARARRCYAGSAPITRASGTRLVVLARVARNRRLADALYMWAFCTLTTSAGARAYYAAHRARGHTHHQALRAPGQPAGRHPPRLSRTSLLLLRDRGLAIRCPGGCLTRYPRGMSSRWVARLGDSAEGPATSTRKTARTPSSASRLAKSSSTPATALAELKSSF
jgi:hypothetical protein